MVCSTTPLLLAISVLLPLLLPGGSIVAEARGTRINIYEQTVRFNRGPGDIANLWNGGFNPAATLSAPTDAMRNALKPNSPNRWTRYVNPRGQYVIPYIVGGSFDDAEHATIAKAMMAIAQNTCIKFQKRGEAIFNPTSGEADFVEIKNERAEGCYTTVGRTTGKNVVMLETNSISTCLEFDIVIHELMHTIGLWHEQMRYDRDDYIRIHYENIAPSYYTQFEKIPETDSTTFGVKYDYESVMHYAKDAFASSSGKITMETIDKRYQDIIGKVKDASPSDYLKICSIYSCSRCMGKPFPIAPEPVVVDKPDEQKFNTSSIFAAVNNTSVDPSSYATKNSNDSAEPPEAWTAQEGEFVIELDGGVISRRPVNNDDEDEVGVPPSQPIRDDEECQENALCGSIVNIFNRKFVCSAPSVRSICCETCFRQKFMSTRAN